MVPGDQQQPPVAGVQQPPIAGMQQPPIAGMQQPPIAGVQQPTIGWVQHPPVAGMQQPPVAGMQQPPVAGMQQPPVEGVQQPPVAGMQQPSVMVVQQPILINSHNRKSASPFVLRGARFSNGRKCPGVLFIFMITFGAVLTIVGFTPTVMWGPHSVTGPVFLLLGVVTLVAGIYLCQLARRQFNELPPTHPHRLKYGTGQTLPIQTVNGVTTYQFPPGPQMVTYPTPSGGYPVATAGQPGTYPVQAMGQTGYPVQVAGQMGSPYIGQPGSCPVPPGGQTYQPSSPLQEPYKGDLPPTYLEVTQNTK